MELASILVSLKTIAIIAIVLVLQVITLVQIAGLRKALRELKEIKAAPAPVPAPSPDRFERKGGDFRRHEKRPYQDQRPRSQPQNQAPAATPPAAAADPVETSLRDINLRLKNAERDQDFARKKIQENLGVDREQHPRGHDRSDRGNDRYRDSGDRNRESADRGDRDRNRGGRDGSRDRNRNPRRDNWQDRNRQMPPQTQQTAAPVAPPVTGEPTFERKEFVAAPQPSATAPVEQTAPMTPVTSAAFSPAPLPAVDQAPADFSGTDEGLEHGRKVFVKRRPLNGESEGPDTQASTKEESPVSASEGADAEIQFGRRKGL
jgi:hypothetical protein